MCVSGVGNAGLSIRSGEVKNVRRTVWSVVLVGVAAGCVPQSKNLEVELARLDRNLGDLRSLQAEQVTEIAAMRTELRQLSGRLDEI